MTLLYSVKDALRFKDLLTEQFKVKSDNISLCLNPTKRELQGFLELNAKGIDKNSNVIIYYSGHSTLTKSKGLELLPVDAESAGNMTINDLYGYFINSGYLLTFWDVCTYNFKP